MTVSEAATFLRLSKSSLDKFRCFGGGPIFVRLGARRVVYRRTDLEGWAATGVRRSTSDGGSEA